jgi:hypothetical protein
MMKEEPRHSGDARFSGNWLTVFAGVGLFPVAHAGVYRAGSRREIPAPFNIKITPVGGIETS